MTNQWMQDREFLRYFQQSKMSGQILLGPNKSYIIYQFAKQAIGLDGDIAELGVLRGATASILAKAVLSTSKKVYLFDSFEGLPEPTQGIDICHKGQFKADLETVKKFLSNCPNVVFCPGFFPGSIANLQTNKYSCVHIDVDLYQSTLDGLTYFYPRMVSGGIILFDDYNFPHTPGVSKAIKVYMGDKPERVIISSSEHQAYVIKL